jgi:hypothetical protein
MDLVEKLEAWAKRLDRHVVTNLPSYNQKAADDRELLEATIREIKDQRAWIATLTQRSRTTNTPSF